MLRRAVSGIGALAMMASMSLAATAQPARGQSRIGAGDNYTCEISGADTYCWGANFNGQLGTGGPEDQRATTPERVRTPRGVAFTGLAVGDFHACGISDAGTYCWGSNMFGALGDGGTTNQGIPVRVHTPRGVAFTRFAVGEFHTCGISDAGTYCWGQDTYGELGDGGTADQGTPVRVHTPRGVAFTQLSAGGATTCGISDAGTYCWGADWSGQLGDGGTAIQRTPVRVRTPPGVAFTQLAAGWNFACGISGADTFCWGHDTFGELGDGGTGDRRALVRVRTPSGVAFSQIAAMSIHICGTGDNGTYCWGGNAAGELGDGSTTLQRTPVRVLAPDGVAFTQVTAGDSHSCGISGSRTFCWGDNFNGELGDGGTTNRPTPVEVGVGGPPVKSATGGVR